MNDPGITVRPATAGDVDDIVDVGHETWHATYTSIAGEEYVREGLAKWWTTDGIAATVEAGRALVAEVEGRVVGMASWSVDGDVLDLWKLYVRPGAHRRGVGTALMRAVATGPAADLLLVRLAHKDGNVNARRFYERQGFTETHRSPDELGGPDNVWMELRLP